MAHHTHTHPGDVHHGTGTATLEGGRVVRLKDLKDYTVAKGDPDVRGWNVYANDGRRIGEVDELLVDVEAMKVRYLDVDLDRDVLSVSGGTLGAAPGTAPAAGAAAVPGAKSDHVLIPIGSAQLDEREDRVIVDLLHTLVGGLPAYEHGPVTREYETSVRQHFDRDYRHDPERDREFYNHDLYNDDRFWSKRRRR